MSNLLNPYRYATAGYTASATNFDGTNDYLKILTDLTGAVDGKQITVSAWVNWNGGDGVAQDILLGGGGTRTVKFHKNSSNQVSLLLENAAGTLIGNLTSTSTYTSSATWYHIIASVDLAVAGSGYMYVTDVAEVSAYTGTNDTIDLTPGDWGVGARAGGTNKLNGCLSELWYDDSYLDLSVTANRRKFINASGKPVSLGANGEDPLGSSPLIYLPNPFGTFETNAGTGGDFTVTGALTACADSPSD